MKRNLLAITVLLAIAGLTFVQFRLLVIGARLEKQRFDQRALVAQRNIRQALNEENSLSKALVEHLKAGDQSKDGATMLADSLQVFLKDKFAEVDITAQFSYAIVSRHSEHEIEFSSNHLDADKFDFGEYIIPLGNYFSSQLFREKILYIDVENLFAYLLRELDYLVIPSVLCLLAIIICLAFLLGILKKEQKLNTVKNDFINNLTHELKTPIFSIALSNKLAKENLDKGNYGKVGGFLQIIENENDRLKTHTEKVLELASLENAKKQLQFELFDLHVLINEVVNEFLPKVEHQGGEIIFRTEATLFKVQVDEIHFKNILNNLLDNSLKYSNGNPRVEVATKSNNSSFILSVKDNGIGISASDQKLVFDKFFRASSGDMHTVKGFGLGLSYVKQVVKAHKGKIAVESKIGEGTVFSIYLPV